MMASILKVLLLALLILPSRGWAEPFSEPLESVQFIRAEHLVSLRLIGFKESGDAEIELRTRAGVRLYAKNLKAHYRDSSGIEVPLSITGTPPAQREFDEWYKEERELYHAGTVLLLSGPTAPPGSRLEVLFEACNTKLCLLPAVYEFELKAGSVGVPRAELAPFPPDKNEVKAESTKSAKAARVAVKKPLPPIAAEVTKEPTPTALPKMEVVKVNVAKDTLTENILTRIRAGGIWLFPLIFLAGMLMNLTPCVYPMIPITLSVLGGFGKNAGVSRWAISGVYVLGISLSYSIMGLVVALSGGLFGSLLQSVWVQGALALLMALLGLAMLGVLNLGKLQALGMKLSSHNRSPLLGALLMGAVSGLVAAPCTGPVLASLLLVVASLGDPVSGFLMLFVFALGFGTPYFALGMASANIKRLPKVGAAGELIKIVFAALMFALALYYARVFIKPFVPILYLQPTTSFVIIAVVLALLSMVLLRVKTFPNGIAVAVALLASTTLAHWGTLAALSSFSSHSQIAWESSFDVAAERARAEHKMLLVDIWADWCAACKEMDATTWINAEVVQAVRGHFVAVKIDFTTPSSQGTLLVEKWQLGGLPAVAIFPRGSALEEMPPILYREKVEATQFLEQVQRLK